MARGHAGRLDVTLGQMNALVSQRLNEAVIPTFYPSGEITAALNEAQRFFCLLTLALEKTVAWVVPAATPFFHMLSIVDGASTLVFPDWIVPLRVSTESGAKVRPARFETLWALDARWIASPGEPVRYVHAGADLVALYSQPDAPAVLNVTFARCPVMLALDSDVPEVPPEYHPELVKYAIHRMRMVEGGTEFSKTLPLLAEFLDAAQKYGSFVRARNKGSSYDAQPPELASFDRSRLLGLSKSRG